MARRARKSRAGLERWKQLIACLRDMNFAFNNVRLYPPTHKEVTAVISKLHAGLSPVLDETDDVGFGFMDEMLYVEGAISIEETANNQMLVDRFAKCRVKYLTIMKGVTQQDLTEFFKLMNAEANKPSMEPPGEILARNGVRTIHVVEAEVDDVASKSKMVRRRTLLDWYEKAVATLKSTDEELLGGPNADLKPLYRLADDLMATIRTKGYEPFLLLPLLGRGMQPHVAHSVNVAILSCALGELYGLNSGQIQTLCVGAFLHDLGRSTIPLEWTENPSPLGLFERAAVSQHRTWGFLLLARNDDIPTQIPLLAAHHHEKPGPAGAAAAEDGYTPDILHKILNLADTYDLANFSDRWYWRKHRQDRVLKSILRHRGRWYDPTLAKLLVQLVGLYPVGTLVRLDDGQRGVVVRANAANVARPQVYLFEAKSPPPDEAAPSAPSQAADGEQDAPPVIVDLMRLEDNGLGFARSIRSTLSEGPGLDAMEIVAKKKEYLLSFNL
ncbi:MAG: HD domain-containing protein [Elusimicrobiota bacterium]